MDSAHEFQEFKFYPTHIELDNIFICLSGRYENFTSMWIEKTLEKAQDKFESDVGPILQGNIKEGLICTLKYPISNSVAARYVRAKIINLSMLSSGLVGVKFMDNGGSDFVPVAVLKSLESHESFLLTLPSQSTDYYLRGIMISPDSWHQHSFNIFKQTLCGTDIFLRLEDSSLNIVTVNFKGKDLTTILTENEIGNLLPIETQKQLLQILALEKNEPCYQPNFTASPNFDCNQVDQSFLENDTSEIYDNSTSSITTGSFNPLQNSECSGNHYFVAKKSDSIQYKVILPTIAEEESTPGKYTYPNIILEENLKYEVMLSFVEAPELFAVRLLANEHKLQNMIVDLNLRVDCLPIKYPTTGTACLARILPRERLYRAVITHVFRHSCRLYFVDYGYTQVIPYRNIYNIPYEFVIPDAFAIRVCLSGLKGLKKGPCLNEIFKQIISGRHITLKIVAPEGPPLLQYGELYVDNKNVIDVIQMKLQEFYFRKAVFSMGDRIPVFIPYLESCTNLFVQFWDTSDDLNALMNDLQYHCGVALNTDLPMGAACCAKFSVDGLWYRAKIVEYKDQEILVQNVDKGWKELVHISNIKTISEELTKLPEQAIKCTLKGFENTLQTTITSDTLARMILGRCFTACIDGFLPDDTIIVSLFDENINPPVNLTELLQEITMSEVFNAFGTVLGLTEDILLEGTDNQSTSVYDSHPQGLVLGIRGIADIWDPINPPILTSLEWRNSLYFEPPPPNIFPLEFTNINSSGILDRWDPLPPPQLSNRSISSDLVKIKKSLCDGDSPPNMLVKETLDLNKQKNENSSKNTLLCQEAAACQSQGAIKKRKQFSKSKTKLLPDPVPFETAFTEPTIQFNVPYDLLITWITSPEDFYVQIMSYQVSFMEMMKKIPKLYKNVKPCDIPVPVGASVLARFPVDKALYRARVLSVEPSSKYIVQYVDIGKEYLIDSKDIWQLDKRLMKLPKIVVHSSLFGVAPNIDSHWKPNPEIYNYFEKGTLTGVFQNCVNGIFYVSLWDERKSVADILIEKGLAVPQDKAPSTLND